MPISEGQPAPSIDLQDTDGNAFSLEKVQGKHVIVYFYPKDDTPGCTKEAQSFRDLFSDFESENVVIVGISPDDAKSHDEFRCKYDLPFTLLCDPEMQAINAYEAYGEKERNGVKTMGIIRSTAWIGPDGNIRQHWKTVANAEDHPHEILAAVKSAES